MKLLSYIFISIFASYNLLTDGIDRFVGKVVVEWLDEDGDDRRMKLKSKFSYVDPTGKHWDVPSGTIIDGASIPSIFWSLVGPPFVGDYRKASVVHDFYCDAKTEKWQDVHLMFYNACLTGGVNEKKAKVMYSAVYAGGPRWEKTRLKGLENKYVILIEKEPQASYDDMKNIEKWIEDNNPNIEQIKDTLDKITVEVLKE